MNRKKKNSKEFMVINFQKWCKSLKFKRTFSYAPNRTLVSYTVHTHTQNMTASPVSQSLELLEARIAHLEHLFLEFDTQPGSSFAASLHTLQTSFPPTSTVPASTSTSASTMTVALESSNKRASNVIGSEERGILDGMERFAGATQDMVELAEAMNAINDQQSKRKLKDQQHQSTNLNKKSEIEAKEGTNEESSMIQRQRRKIEELRRASDEMAVRSARVLEVLVSNVEMGNANICR